MTSLLRRVRGITFHWNTIGLLALICALVIAKGVVWTIVVPMFEQPDEVSHWGYVDNVMLTGDLTRGPRPASRQFDGFRVALDEGAMHFRPEQKGSMDDHQLERREQALRDLADSGRRTGKYRGTAESYPALSYGVIAATEQVAQADRPDTAFLLARVVNVAWSVVTAIGLWFLFREILGATWQVLSAVLFVELMPMFSSIQSAINPDNLMTAIVTWACVCIVRIAKAGQVKSLAPHITVSVLIALGLLTKQTIFAVMIPYALVMAVVFVRSAGSRRRVVVSGAMPLMTLIVVSLVMSAIPARTGGYGAPAVLVPPLRFDIGTIENYLGYLQREGYERFVNLFWGGWGWVDVPSPLAVGYVGCTLLVFGLSAVTIRWADRGVPLYVVALVAMTVAWVLMIVTVEYSSVMRGFGGIMQGRYLFPAIGAIVGLVYWGIVAAFERRPRMGAFALVMLPVGMALYHAFALANLVIPRYYL